MGGTRAAYAPPSRGVGSRNEAKDAHAATIDSVHSVRRGQPTRLVNNQASDSEDDVGDNGHTGRKAMQDNGGPRGHGNMHGAAFDDDLDDEDDDDYDDDFIEERERELQREREELRARLTFKDESRRSLKEKWMNSMRRKRRMLMRNENLRFRELYKPPEPGVLLTVIAVVTIVTLILTKSWPFY